MNPSTNLDYIWLYSGNLAAASGENPAATFGAGTANYAGVWHLADNNATESISGENAANRIGGIALTNHLLFQCAEHGTNGPDGVELNQDVAQGITPVTGSISLITSPRAVALAHRTRARSCT